MTTYNPPNSLEMNKYGRIDISMTQSVSALAKLTSHSSPCLQKPCVSNTEVQRWGRFYTSSTVIIFKELVIFILVGVNLLTKYFTDLSKQAFCCYGDWYISFPNCFARLDMHLISLDNLKSIWWKSWGDDSFYSQWFTPRQFSWFGFQYSKNHGETAMSQTSGLWDGYRGLGLTLSLWHKGIGGK